MVAATPQSLSDPDQAILANFLDGYSATQIAHHLGLPFSDLLDALPRLSPHLAAIAAFSDLLLRATATAASTAAIDTLAAVCRQSPDPIERRRAAVAIIRARTQPTKIPAPPLRIAGSGRPKTP